MIIIKSGVQLQKGLIFVVVDRGNKQQILDTHNQCGINIPIFFFFLE